MPFSPPAVTVIIPMYRAVSLVAEAIRSIQAQTVPVTFVIAVDDGCPEGSADYVAREFPEVQVLRKPHGGLAETLNHGVQAAKTDWIAFLDHDDRWLPTKMELQWEALKRDPSLDMIFAFAQPFLMTPEGEKRLEALAGVCKSGGLFRASLIAKAGEFGGGHDFIDWYARAMEAGARTLTLPEVLFERRIHDHNMGVSDKAGQTKGYLLTLKTMLDRRRAGPSNNGNT